MVNSIFKRIESFARKKGLIEEGDRILLAVSGGPDSIFLFHFFLYFLKKQLINIKVSYIHHHLRKEADNELEFVKNLANYYNLEFFQGDIEINSRSNIEKTLREKRYEKLYEIAEKTRCNKIATGHTLDDHVETFLMNLLRGSGLSGLCGIWPKNKIFKNSEISIIRPLLCVEKREIIEYLKKNNIEYMIDLSNLSKKFFRNKIRNEVVPFLLKYKQNFKKIIFRTTEILQQEEEFLKKYSEDLAKEIIREEGKIIIDIKKFKVLEKAIKRRIVGYIYKNLKKTPYLNFISIDKILRSIENGENVLDKEKLEEILKGKKITNFFKYKIKIPGETFILERISIKTEFVPFSEEIFRNPDRFTGYFDFSKIDGDIIVRSRKIGDKFIPLGMKKEKRVSRFMIDKKIPKNQRDRILIFENNGKIMWICGYEISEEFKVERGNKQILKIEVKIV